MPFGKHKGKEVSEVPKGYLRWLLNNGELYGSLASEIASVLGEESSELSENERVDRAKERTTKRLSDEDLAMKIVGTWEEQPI